MSRITIVLDDTIQKKLRNKQAEELRQSEKSVSFSSIINKELAKVLGVKIDKK